MTLAEIVIVGGGSIVINYDFGLMTSANSTRLITRGNKRGIMILNNNNYISLVLLEMDENGTDIPSYLRHDIEEYLKGKSDPTCTHMDCLEEELSASINCAEVDGEISIDDAWNLREELLGM